MTKIEWCDETWNVVTGCSHVSKGCEHCYAERGWPRLAGNKKTVYFDRKFTDVQCHEDRLAIPLRWKKPRRVFVNSMSDLFHPDVPDGFIRKVFAVMSLCPQHTFQILTKRPDEMRRWIKSMGGDVGERPMLLTYDDPEFHQITRHFNGIDYPDNGNNWPLPNVWLGVSIEDQKTADERIPILLQTPAAIRFVSYEPALGPVDFRKKRCIHHDRKYISKNEEHEFCRVCGDGGFTLTMSKNTWMGDEMVSGIDWIIIGGESGSNARAMHPDWVGLVCDQCQEAGVPFFFKQWGEWAPNKSWLPESLIEKDMNRMAGSQSGKWNPEFDMLRVGKKTAGRLLDGREWNEFPV